MLVLDNIYRRKGADGIMARFLEVIRESFLFFPVIALLFTLPYIIWNYRRYGSLLSLRILIVYSFILYMMTMFFLVLLPLPTAEELAMRPAVEPNFRPFSLLRSAFAATGAIKSEPSTWLLLLKDQGFREYLLNIVMLIPFGVYLRYYFRCGFFTTVLASFGLSLIFELTQLTGVWGLYEKAYRTFDVEDLISNTAGGLIGWVLAGVLTVLLPSRDRLDQRSYERGAHVTVGRRIFTVLVDVGILGAAELAATQLLGQPESVLFGRRQFVIAALYFCLTPLLLHGCTPGMLITRLRLVGAKGKSVAWYQYLIRYGLVFVCYALIPGLIAWSLFHGYQLHHYSKANVMAGLVTLIFCWVFFLLITLDRAAGNHPAFYARLSGTRLVTQSALDKNFVTD